MPVITQCRHSGPINVNGDSKWDITFTIIALGEAGPWISVSEIKTEQSTVNEIICKAALDGFLCGDELSLSFSSGYFHSKSLFLNSFCSRCLLIYININQPLPAKYKMENLK